jgi:DNA polymerase-3 subunit alpha
MEECKSMGISTLGPDVNESYSRFGVNEKGEIRFGLSAIKGMGEAAAAAIVCEREKKGPYKTIFDFAERVDFCSVNRKAFESLALSGGFDGFGIRREQYFGVNTKGEMFLDTLVKYGQLYQAEQAEAQNSLFGGEDAVDIATPPVPEGTEWSTIEKLNRERDLVGIYLSAHPLDDYRIVLNNICNTHCSKIDDKEALSKKEEIVMGGIVTAVKSKFTKTGKPCGFVTIEDFEGSGEFAFFGEDWGRWRGMLSEGCAVFITGKCVQRYRDSSYYDFKVSDIQYLQTVKDERIEKITIDVDSEALDETIVNDINTIVADKPGKAALFFQVHDRKNHNIVLLRAKDLLITIPNKLIELVESNPDMNYHIN